MSKRKSIQLDIPHPCTQNWDEMTPCSTGRYCSHCQKTVIDFTTWTDTALYSFFSKNTENVCGRMFVSQLHHPINIPPQPHSRLYRLTIALGLTLMFVETQQAFSQNRPPKVEQNSILQRVKSAGKINGKVFNINKQPIANATVEVYKDKTLKKSVQTNSIGDFFINFLDFDHHDIVIKQAGFHQYTVYNIRPELKYNVTNIQVELDSLHNVNSKITIKHYRKPLENWNKDLAPNLDSATFITGGISANTLPNSFCPISLGDSALEKFYPQKKK